jgi:hypothetical protein
MKSINQGTPFNDGSHMHQSFHNRQNVPLVLLMQVNHLRSVDERSNCIVRQLLQQAHLISLAGCYEQVHAHNNNKYERAESSHPSLVSSLIIVLSLVLLYSLLSSADTYR